MMVIGLAMTTDLVYKTTSLFSRADASILPSGTIEVANISETGFTLLWSTSAETIGAVYFGKTTSLGDGVAVDDRNVTMPSGKFQTHFVRVPNLKASTKYFYRVSNVSNTESPSEISTGPIITTQGSGQDPIFGKVTDQNDGPISGALVIWEAGSSYTKIAALTKNDGSFVLPVALSRTSDLGSFAPLSLGLSEKISITLNGETTLVTCRLGEDRPLPSIRLGEPGDCKQLSLGGKTATGSAGFKDPLTSGSATSGLRLNLTENEVVSPLPTFSGKASPNQMVRIVVKSPTEYSGAVKTDPSGNWTWAPPTSLAPGKHTITVSVTNPDGSIATVGRNFSVASDIPILPITAGTPSAEPSTHKACVSQSCVIVTGVGSDTCLANSDCVAPTPSVPPPEPSTPPSTGAIENTMLILVGGLLLTGLGALFAL